MAHFKACDGQSSIRPKIRENNKKNNYNKEKLE